jgi:hypothetical protein
MENQLQTVNQSLSTPLNNQELQIASAVWNVNLCVAYPLTDPQIEVWAKTIYRLRPETTVDELNEIMDSFMTGVNEWDTKLGIQNIFKAIRNKKGKSIIM